MHTLPELPYSYEALEPYVSRDIMELHHSKHHQTYVDKLNAALKDAPEELATLPIAELLGRLDELPGAVRQAVRNNGGGHYNHSLFWQMMQPNGTGAPSGQLLKDIEQKYGSFEEFKDTFAAEAAALFGSGWIWLQPDLSIVKSPNQDSPVMDGQPEPILGLDVWEHAYYLDYKNVRPDYVTAWWNVVNWDFVQVRYENQ